jgi:hypothetical protein
MFGRECKHKNWKIPLRLTGRAKVSKFFPRKKERKNVKDILANNTQTNVFHSNYKIYAFHLILL